MPCASHVLHLVFAGKGQGSWTFHDGSRYYHIHLRYQPPLPIFFFLAYLYLFPSPPLPTPRRLFPNPVWRYPQRIP